MGSICLCHLVHLHILMIYRNIVKFLEVDSVKTVCKSEHRIDAAFKLEIRLKLLRIECVFRLLVTL